MRMSVPGAISRIGLTIATCISGLAMAWGLYRLLDLLGPPPGPLLAGVLIGWGLGSIVAIAIAMVLVRYQGVWALVTSALLLGVVATALVTDAGGYGEFFLTLFLVCFLPPTLLGLCLEAYRRRRVLSISDL